MLNQRSVKNGMVAAHREGGGRGILVTNVKKTAKKFQRLLGQIILLISLWVFSSHSPGRGKEFGQTSPPLPHQGFGQSMISCCGRHTSGLVGHKLSGIPGGQSLLILKIVRFFDSSKLCRKPQGKDVSHSSHPGENGPKIHILFGGATFWPKKPP